MTCLSERIAVIGTGVWYDS